MNKIRCHTKGVFVMLSVFIFSFSKAQNCVIRGGKINKADRIAQISRDVLLDKNIDTSVFLRMFYASLDTLEGSHFVYFVNKAETQYCRMSSSATDGFWNDYISVGNDMNQISSETIKLSRPSFSVNNCIRIGMKDEEVIHSIGKSVDCILTHGRKKVLKYYWFDKNSLDFTVYKFPSYVCTFVFENERLVKLGFGKYRAELDKDFSPKDYKIIKGRLY